jgi:hypothetical protein
MTQSTATNCRRCGGVLPRAGDACPACGQPTDPDATWHPGPVLLLPPGRGVADGPARLPFGLLALLATACALMGLAVGMWLGMGRTVPAGPTRTELPTLPAPGPASSPRMPSSTFYPVPPARPAVPPLPPARVDPLLERRQMVDRRRPFRTDWRALPAPAHRPRTGRRSSAAQPPLRVRGMATVRVRNPSSAPVEIVFSGEQAQKGIVGPNASVDLLIPPGRYDIALSGSVRTQRIYDAPLAEGDVLDLVYNERLGTGDRPAAGD